MREIKVWGGIHPDEKAALACVDSLFTDPIPNVTPGIGNPKARDQGKRYVDTNLSLAFPGDPASALYEKRRAAEVLEESQGFDVVIDLHNINHFGSDAAIVSRERGISPVALGFLGRLGIKYLLASDWRNQLYSHVTGAFVLETVASGRLGRNPEILRSAFDDLANNPDPPKACARDFKWFRYLKCLNVNTEPITPGCLDPDLRAFTPLPEVIAAKADCGDMPICLMGWRNVPHADGLWAEVVTPIATPDTSLWPG